MRPLAELGKPAFNAAGYSFLRRTEYISSEAKARAEASVHAARATARSPASAKVRKSTEAQKDDPMHMLRDVIKGFDLAYPDDAYTGLDSASNLRGSVPSPAEVEAWKTPKHPSKPDVKLVDAYPLKPDLDAITDSGAFVITKFTGNPSAATESRDTRMDVGILYPRERDSGALEYDFFLPADGTVATNFKAKSDVKNTNRDDPELYTHEMTDGAGAFRFPCLRTYDTGRRVDSVAQQFKEVALALHDFEGDRGSHQEQGAYYYPIISKIQLKPRRNKNLAQLGLASQAVEEDLAKIDWMNVTVRDPDEEEVAGRARHRADMESENMEIDGEAD